MYGRKLSNDEIENASKKRMKIMHDGEVMGRLKNNPDFIEFLKMLEEDKEGLIQTLLNENINTVSNTGLKIRLIARINQIDRVIKKPQTLIWRMKNLTEVRTALKGPSKTRREAGSR